MKFKKPLKFHHFLQRVGDEENDEAEAMIRAITHGEIDQKVYSQMADDLENAAKLKRKGMAIWVMENPREGQKSRKILSQTGSYSKEKFVL